MLIVGFLILWAGYTAVYVGLYRLTGDKRPVSAIFLGTAS
jgi:hypothetical protein